MGTALKAIGYDKNISPKTWRILDGRSLYSTPKVKKAVETGQPYDDSDKGKVIPIYKSGT